MQRIYPEHAIKPQTHPTVYGDLRINKELLTAWRLSLYCRAVQPVCVSLSSGVCVEAEALQMKDALTPTQMNTLKYLLRSTIRLLHKAHRVACAQITHIPIWQCAVQWVGRSVCVCVGGKVGQSQTTCRPQARFVPALLGEARQTPPQWCACASVTPGLCKGPPLRFTAR